MPAVRIRPGARGMTRGNTQPHPAQQPLVRGTRTTGGPSPYLVQSPHGIAVCPSGCVNIPVGSFQRFVSSPTLRSPNFNSLPYPLRNGRVSQIVQTVPRCDLFPADLTPKVSAVDQSTPRAEEDPHLPSHQDIFKQLQIAGLQQL